MNLQEITKNLTPAELEIFKKKLKEYENILNLKVSTLSPEDATKLLTYLNNELLSLNNKCIQLETQIGEKEKTLDKKIEELKKQFSVSSLEELEKKEAALTAELQKSLDEMKAFLQ